MSGSTGASRARRALPRRDPRASAAGAPAPGSVAELFSRWVEHRDRDARDMIVAEFMPLASSLARRYRHSSEPVEDLVQVAALALVKAVDRFDPRRGVSFAAYAIPTILGELRRYFRDSGWALHVPRADKELAQMVAQAERQILSETGRVPTAQRLAEFLELDVERVLVGLGAARAYVTQPFDAPDGEYDGTSGGETHGTPDPGFQQVERRMMLAAALRRASERDAELLRLRFGEELSQAEIGARIGVSQMHVSRLLRKCLEGLRESVDG